MTDRYPIFDNEAVFASLPQEAVPIVVVCEHASNTIPIEFSGLGLNADARNSHAAWDPGAMPVATRLAETLNASLIAGKASRLLFDLNRPPEAFDAMPQRSEVFDIPGNQNLSNTARADRVVRFHDPFHTAMIKLLDRQAPQLMITIHSFTPVYNGLSRAVEIGILHDDDSRFADALLACAGDHTAQVVRRNDPYGPEHGVTHTLKKHALPRGIHNVMIEVRNDLIATADQQAAMATMMSGWMRAAMAACDIPQEGGTQCPA